MNPADNLEKLHRQIDALNRTLKFSSEEKVTEGGRTWTFRKGQEIPLDDIQKIIPESIREKEGLRPSLEILRHQVLHLYKDTPAKQVVLDRLNQLVPSKAEMVLEDIEKELPNDCFPPFKRDAHGKLINPEDQLEKFRQLLNSNPVHLELRDTPEKPLTAQDYVKASKKVLDHDFIRIFSPILPAGLDKESQADEARKFMINHPHWWPDALFINTTIIPPEVASISRLNKITFKGSLHIPQRLLTLERLSEVNIPTWGGTRLPDWIYAMPQVKTLGFGNLQFDLSRLPHIQHLKIGTVQSERKDPYL